MHLLILSDASDGGKTVIPALEFLDHTMSTAPLLLDGVGVSRDADVVIVDATADLARASQACRVAASAEAGRPVLLVIAASGLAALKASWGFDDFLLPDAGPPEVETRLRILAGRARPDGGSGTANIGDLAIDEHTYVVRLRGIPLDLTYREFELLTFLAHSPGRVFTRAQLLQEVWGYDYFGGTRTVDVHIRRLRAKLGPEYDALIGTVRGVGYKLDPHGPARPSRDGDAT